MWCVSRTIYNWLFMIFQRGIYYFRLIPCGPVNLLKLTIVLYFTINILFVSASDTGRGLMTTKALQVSNVDCNAGAPLGSLNCNH